MTRSELKNTGVVELLLALLQSEQDNEYFLHHRRSGRYRSGRGIFRIAYLTTDLIGMPNGNDIRFDLIASGARRAETVQNRPHRVNASAALDRAGHST
jgi:hypothetical protein